MLRYLSTIKTRLNLTKWLRGKLKCKKLNCWSQKHDLVKTLFLYFLLGSLLISQLHWNIAASFSKKQARHVVAAAGVFSICHRVELKSQGCFCTIACSSHHQIIWIKKINKSIYLQKVRGRCCLTVGRDLLERGRVWEQSWRHLRFCPRIQRNKCAFQMPGAKRSTLEKPNHKQSRTQLCHDWILRVWPGRSGFAQLMNTLAKNL